MTDRNELTGSVVACESLDVREDLSVGGALNALVPGSFCFSWGQGVAWADVYEQMQAKPGPKICMVGWEVPGGIKTMTDNGGLPTDLNDVLFVGVGGAGGEDTTPTIAVAQNFKLQDRQDYIGTLIARLASKDVHWDFSALTAPAYVVPNNFTDEGIITLDGGRFDGPNGGVPFIDGVCWLSMRNVFYGGGFAGKCRNANSILRMNAGCQVLNSPYTDDGGGNSITVVTDASCDWHRSTLVAEGLFPSLTLNNFARGPLATSGVFEISVNGVGVVIATPYP